MYPPPHMTWKLTLKTCNLGMARSNGLISRLDDVCRLLQPPLEVLVLTALRVHVQWPSGILTAAPAALGSAASAEASGACSDSSEAVLRWAQRSAASCGPSRAYGPGDTRRDHLYPFFRFLYEP